MEIGDSPADIIKKAREAKGLTQTEVGAAIGVGLRQYQKIEAGEFPKFKRELITNLDKTLGTNVYELIYDPIFNNQEHKAKKNLPNAKLIGTPVGTYTNKSGNEFIELSDGSYIMTTPLVTKKAYAGYLTGWGDEEYLAELPKHSIPVEKPHSGEYISIEITGQSMNDGTGRSFVPGDIATGRKINRKLWRDSKLHLKSYREFIIIHKNGILLKAITEHNTSNNKITIHSYNPDKEEYPDQVIKLEEVLQIFNVVKNTQNRSNKL